MDLAKYLKSILPEISETYAIKPAFANISTDENIQEGVLAFKAFLCRLYEVLNKKGGVYDNCKKAAHEYENRTTLSVYYPFLHNVKTLLMNIGYCGLLAENTQTLACGNTIFNDKLSVSKTFECLQFLIDCGLDVNGVDLEKKQNLPDIKAIEITCPDNPAMLTGLKVMAIAETDHGSLVNQDVFLRCDYRILKKDETDVVSIVEDTIKPLSPGVRDFILRLHQRYLDKGLTCVVEIKGFHIYIKYCYKRKDVWGLNASLNNGWHINIKAIKTAEYPGTIKTLPPFLQEMIAKGYGCGRKREIGRCDGGCRGLIVSLDNSVLDFQDDLVAWFDQELLCLQTKKRFKP